MLMRALPALAVSAFCAASFLQIISPPAPRLLYNHSQSAPVGWYKVDHKRALKRGDQVAAFAPATARHLAHARGYLPRHIPLIKTVWAIAGDRVCHEDERVRVTNRPDLSVLTQDSLGRPLPTRTDCYTLQADELFLVSTDVQTSWDSRYFGPVPLSDVIGPVHYLGTPARPQALASGGLGTGSGRGGPDKRREAHASLNALPAHHFWGAFGPLREVPAGGANPDQNGAFRRPPQTKTTRTPPGILP